MYQTDFDSFALLLKNLGEVFGKPPTDTTTQAYWRALKDQPIEVVRRMAEVHTQRGRYFPKPAELRPKEDRPAVSRDAAMEAAFKEGEQRAVTNLDEVRRENPEQWRNDAWLRKLDRILATHDPSSPIYAQALEESHRLRPLVRGY